MKYSVKQIAQILNGIVEGNPDDQVERLSKIEEGMPGSLCFLSNPAYTKYIYSTKATAVIVDRNFIPEHPIVPSLIKVKNPEVAFGKILEFVNQQTLNKIGISPKSEIAASASIAENVYIGDFVFIGENVVIGNNVKIFPQVFIGDNCVVDENTVLYPGVKVYHNCQIGKNCIIHAGSVIGSDGFRFSPQEKMKIPQTGNVIIEDDCELGANCCIDRATLGSTILRKGVKFDNLIHVAHNVEIGENTYIAASTSIAGSAKIGSNCLISGQVGIIGHIKIGEGTMIAPQSGISKSTRPGEILIGSPAIELNRFKKAIVHFKNLDEIEKRLSRLEKLAKQSENQENENDFRL